MDLEGRSGGEEGKALCLAMSIPQGGGKTTLAKSLEVALRDVLGIRTAIVSYDDFYLTYEEQRSLADANPNNFYV